MNLIKKYIPTILLLLIFGCGPSNEIINLESDFSNALRADFTFSTKRIASVRIEFWETGKNQHYLSKSSVDTTHHRITLLDLKPQTRYEHQFIMESENDITRSGIYTFVSDTLPYFLPEMVLEIDSGGVFEGNILIRNVQAPGQQIMINNQGKVVWYQEFDTTLFRPFSWTEDQTILALKSDKAIHEMNLKGDIIYNLEYGERDFNELLHHEIIKDKNGNIVSLIRKNQVFDLSGMGGSPSDTIKGDGIIVINPTGEKKWVWNLFDHVNPLKDPDILKSKDDWSHANSLGIDVDGHYLVSFRHFNQIWKVHSGSGEVIWKLGIGGDLGMQPDQYFYLQHAAHINAYGELMLFDNGGPGRMTSRAISFTIDPETKEVLTGRINVFLPKSLFSFKQGSAYLIDDDKILFCSSIKKSIVVSDLEGNILWHLELSESVYRANYIGKVDWLNTVKK